MTAASGEMCARFAALYERGAIVTAEAWRLGRWMQAIRGKTTLHDVAIRAGCRPTAVSAAEAGTCSLEKMQQVAAAHGYDVEFVLVRKEQATEAAE